MDNQHTFNSLLLVQQQRLRRCEQELSDLRDKVKCFAPTLFLDNENILVLEWRAMDNKITFDVTKYLENGMSHEDLVSHTDERIFLCVTAACEYISFDIYVYPPDPLRRPCLSIGTLFGGDSIDVYPGEQALEMLDKLQELFQQVYMHCDQGNTAIVENFNEFCRRCEIARKLIQ